MIQTIKKVPYDTLDITKVVTVKAKVLSSKFNTETDMYNFEFIAWWDELFTEIIDEEEHTFIKKNIIRRDVETFDSETVDNLRDVVLQMFPTDKTGTEREHHILDYAHLMLNNQKNDRNTQWEIAI